MKTAHVRNFALAASIGAQLLLAACSDGSGSKIGGRDAQVNDGGGENDDDAGGASESDARATGDAGAGADANLITGYDGSGPFPVNQAGQVLCGTAPCACSDQLDNDEDGLFDLADPECVSAWDNDEGSFGTGISGDNRDDACQDCFFDGNSGAGDDGCRLPSSCLVDGTPSSGQGSCSSCEQSEQCQTFCQAYTPNGCDCFGCCGVLVAGAVRNVLISADCQIDGDTLEGCTECVPSTTCTNLCGECELCPGKTLTDLPPSCGQTPDGGGPGDDGGTGEPEYSCDEGATRCGDGLPACADTEACTFGCCVLIPIIR